MNPSAERIQLLISLRKYAEAEAMAREQLAKDPESAEALAQLAQVLAASGPNRLNEALASVRQAITADPHSVFAHYLMGWIEKKRGKLRAAEQAYREALRLEPYCLPARTELVLMKLVKHRVADAKAMLSECLTLDPDDADVRHLQCLIELHHGTVSAAEEACRVALQHFPDDPRFHALLGQCYEMRGHFREGAAERRECFEPALHHYRNALWRNPIDLDVQERYQAMECELSDPRSSSRFCSQQSGVARFITLMFVMATALMILVVGLAWAFRIGNAKPGDPLDFGPKKPDQQNVNPR